MTVGARLRARRKQLGFSAEYIAERLGCSPATVYRWENGDIEKMPIDSIVPVAAVLGVTPAYLLGWEDEKTAALPGDGLSGDELKLVGIYRSITGQGRQEMMAHAEYIGERYKKNPSASTGKVV